MKSCTVCKKVKNLTEFHNHPGARDGVQTYCKECSHIKATSEDAKKYNKEYYSSKKGRYNKYKHAYSVMGRDIKFNLTYEEFITFWQKPCYYCGSEIETIGIDRVDNKKDYDMENLIPCCWICNRMKSDLSQEDFISHCKKISHLRT